jgi:hypothetical protein
VKLPLHIPAINRQFPLLISPILNPHQGRRPLMAMAAGMPPPLPSRDYISTPRASPHPLRLHPSSHASFCPRTPLPPLGAPAAAPLLPPEPSRRR